MKAASVLENPIKGPSALAIALGEAPQTVTNWAMRGVSKQGATKAQSVLGISATWILEGSEPMFFGDTSDTVPFTATPRGYIRVMQMGEAGMGSGRENEDLPEIVRTVEYSANFLRSLVGFLPPPGRLVLVTGKGDSMIPTIAPGEVVLVDTGTHTFEGDGLYLVNLGNGQQIKRLEDRGKIFVVSDNPVTHPFEFPEGGIVGGKVYLINKIERVN
ncbi:S24 family peptidase [Xylella fastidiosa]|uniref:S24 family peptidase n=1 Tax=Xylella fastidiosa TaxID=2371 RepID=UPI000422C192|nr:helix-turn-helix transcriptional regulator [Xylella fastidiosa]